MEEERQGGIDRPSPAEAARGHTVPRTGVTCYKGMGTVAGLEDEMEAQPGLPTCIPGSPGVCTLRVMEPIQVSLTLGKESH